MTATTADYDLTDAAAGQESENEIAVYVAAVRNALADVDSEELDELVDDLELHLIEVREETDRPFDEVVGTPKAFAFELRQSAGFPPPPPVSSSNRWSKSSTLERFGRQVRTHPWVQAVASFWPELRPGWWVARGYLLAVLLGLMTSINQDFIFLGTPHVFGSGFVGLLATIGLIILSVRFGRRDNKERSTVATRWVAGLLAAIGGLVLLAWISSANYSNPELTYVGEPYVNTEILPANIYAYLPDGTPVDQVLLFNENGDPIDLPEAGYSERLGIPFEAPLRQDSDGRSIPNLYPRIITADGERFDGLVHSDNHFDDTGEGRNGPRSWEAGQVIVPPLIKVPAGGSPSSDGTTGDIEPLDLDDEQERDELLEAEDDEDGGAIRDAEPDAPRSESDDKSGDRSSEADRESDGAASETDGESDGAASETDGESDGAASETDGELPENDEPESRIDSEIDSELDPDLIDDGPGVGS